MTFSPGSYTIPVKEVFNSHMKKGLISNFVVSGHQIGLEKMGNESEP